MSLHPGAVLRLVGRLAKEQLTSFFRSERFATKANPIPVRKVSHLAPPQLFTAGYELEDFCHWCR